MTPSCAVCIRHKTGRTLVDATLLAEQRMMNAALKNRDFRGAEPDEISRRKHPNTESTMFSPLNGSKEVLADFAAQTNGVHKMGVRARVCKVLGVCENIKIERKM